MCCRTDVKGLNITVAELDFFLQASGFKIRFENNPKGGWERQFPPQPGRESIRRIYADVMNYSGQETFLRFSMSPSIGGHSEGEHEQDALLAAIIFQMAAVLGEKFGTIDNPVSVFQTSLLGPCAYDEGSYKTSQGSGERILGVYPGQPLRHEAICLRFREVMLRGIGLEYGEHGRLNDGESEYNLQDSMAPNARPAVLQSEQGRETGSFPQGESPLPSDTWFENVD